MAAVRRSPLTPELNDGHYRVNNWIVESNAPAALVCCCNICFFLIKVCVAHTPTSDQPLHRHAITNNTLRQVVGGTGASSREKFLV